MRHNIPFIAFSKNPYCLKKTKIEVRGTILQKCKRHAVWKICLKPQRDVPDGFSLLKSRNLISDYHENSTLIDERLLKDSNIKKCSIFFLNKFDIRFRNSSNHSGKRYRFFPFFYSNKTSTPMKGFQLYSEYGKKWILQYVASSSFCLAQSLLIFIWKYSQHDVMQEHKKAESVGPDKAFYGCFVWPEI